MNIIFIFQSVKYSTIYRSGGHGRVVRIFFLFEKSWFRIFAKILNFWTLGFSQHFYPMPNINLKGPLALTSA